MPTNRKFLLENEFFFIFKAFNEKDVIGLLRT